MISATEALSWIPSFHGERTTVVRDTHADIFLDYLFVKSVYRNAQSIAGFLAKNPKLTDVTYDPRLVIPMPVAKHYVSRARLLLPIDGIESVAVHTRKDGR
jgi:hypothetical protein